MRVKVTQENVRVEFPLSQPKRSWKIRIDGKKSSQKILGHKIQEDNRLEWMVNYEELRDILFCFKEKYPSEFQKIHENFIQIKPMVENAEKFKQETQFKIEDITIEIKLLGKQRKLSENFPYVFVLFNLFYTKISDNARVFLVDIYDKKISNTSNRIITIGDTLVWLPTNEEISKIIEKFGEISKTHKNSAKKEIFDKIETLA